MEHQTPLREHPQIRFAAPVKLYDLERVAEKLMEEASDNPCGHNQIALYKHSLTTIALFCFQQGGSIPDHAADGTVFLQVIKGAVTITVAETPQRVQAGQLLVLAPGIPHTILADAPSLMLMTISMEEEKLEDVPPEVK
jgi:quercetin dioxygenase-like cupin family protein